MKMVTLVAIATLTLFLTGCSQQKTATEPSQEQETEQVTKGGSVAQSNTDKTDINFEEAPTHLTGNEEYSGVIAYEFQKVLGFKNGTVFYYNDILAVKLTVSREYIDEADIRDLANDIYDLKTSVVNQYNADHKSYKRMKLRVFDSDTILMAYEMNNSMVLDK